MNIPLNVQKFSQTKSFSEASDKLFNIVFSEAKTYFEKIYLEDLLKRTNGNIVVMSSISKISRNNIYHKLEKYGIDINLYRKTDFGVTFL